MEWPPDSRRSPRILKLYGVVHQKFLRIGSNIQLYGNYALTHNQTLTISLNTRFEIALTRVGTKIAKIAYSFPNMGMTSTLVVCGIHQMQMIITSAAQGLLGHYSVVSPGFFSSWARGPARRSKHKTR